MTSKGNQNETPAYSSNPKKKKEERFVAKRTKQKNEVLQFLLGSPQYEMNEPKDDLQTWLGDEDLFMGDYILVFRNPDKENLDEDLDVEDALLKYDRFFQVDSESYNEAIMQKLVRLSFSDAFKKLKDANDSTQMGQGNEQLGTNDNENNNQKGKGQKGDKNQKTTQVGKGNPVGKGNQKKQQKGQEKENEQQPQKEKDFLSQKIFYGGGYLEKKEGIGLWCRSDKGVSDACTLFRHVILFKLAQKGFKTRQFLSADGSKIFCVLTASEENLKSQAAENGFKKRLKLSMTDIFSLEPVDSSYRPLRISPEIVGKEQNGDQYMIEEKNQINLLLKQINFLKISRELTQPIIHLDPDEIIDASPAKPEVIQTYLNYLKIFNEKLKVVREQIENFKLNEQDYDEIELYKNKRRNFIKLVEEAKRKNAENRKQKKARVNINGNKNKNKKLDPSKSLKIKHINSSVRDIDTEQDFKLQVTQKIFFRKKREYIAELYRQTFEESLRQADPKRKYIKCIWDYLQTNPVNAYSEYFKPAKKKRFRDKQKTESIWLKHQVSEYGKISLFSKVERLKIVYSAILEAMNLPMLVQQEIILKAYPLHDHFDLKGESQLPKFKPVFETAKIDFREPTKDELSKYSLGVLRNWKLKIFQPWYVPEESIVAYYGEKLALYFRFLSYYTFSIFFLGLFGAPLFFLQTYYQEQLFDTSSYDDIGESQNDAQVGQASLSSTKWINLANIFFIIIVSIWSTLFIERWKRMEATFATTYGQLDYEEEEQERPGFQGIYKRSLITDNLNDLYFSPFQRILRIITGILITLICLVFSFLSTWGLFELKAYLQNGDEFAIFKIIRFIDLQYSIPSGINAVQIEFFNIVFTQIALLWNQKENHRTLFSFETSFVLKVFLFQFVNTFNSFFQIAFVKDDIYGIGCQYGDCMLELIYQTRTVFYFIFIRNIALIGYPFLRSSVRQLKNLILGSEQAQVKDPYNEINKEIERQYQLLNPSISPEIDGTVSQYLEIMMQFSLLSLFGIAFPLGFLVTFLTNILSIQVDKYKLNVLFQRPNPQSNCRLGVWLYIFEFISYVAVITNSGILTYTMTSFSKSDSLWTFLTLVVVNFFLKFTVKIVISDVPENIATIIERQNTITERIKQGFANEKDDDKKIPPAIPFFKIYGTTYTALGETDEAADDQEGEEQQQDQDQPKEGDQQ